ncbi:MAG TPA: hypothetical protein PK514_01105, partial [Spirochaetota bacterium]|nr:hypothetical protein [Spirochaetota bacterium]
SCFNFCFHLPQPDKYLSEYRLTLTNTIIITKVNANTESVAIPNLLRGGIFIAINGLDLFC